ncbi:MAG TPA: TetR/AcrR family transcriptional regulator [Acidimicrobiales bacterium]|nr:TetR/AcrR family transcriptional regulator [Acidimicrobiales bacterium]
MTDPDEADDQPPIMGRTARWGDRAARRQDILAAARSQMASRGYLGLNMRDIAAGAGVSAGTLYSYFATKEEIFATLYAEAIEDHNERIAPLCAEATDLEAFLVELITSHLELHGDYGQYFSLWAALVQEAEPPPEDAAHPPPLPAELTAALRRATIRQGDMIAAAFRHLVPGPRVRGEQRRRIAFVWSVLIGVADQLCSERHLISRVDADELIGYAARTIAAGLQAGVSGTSGTTGTSGTSGTTGTTRASGGAGGAGGAGSAGSAGAAGTAEPAGASGTAGPGTSAG